MSNKLRATWQSQTIDFLPPPPSPNSPVPLPPPRLIRLAKLGWTEIGLWHSHLSLISPSQGDCWLCVSTHPSFLPESLHWADNRRALSSREWNHCQREERFAALVCPPDHLRVCSVYYPGPRTPTLSCLEGTGRIHAGTRCVVIATSPLAHARQSSYVAIWIHVCINHNKRQVGK